MPELTTLNKGLIITKDNFLQLLPQLIEVIVSSEEFKKLQDCTQVIFNDNKKDNSVKNRQSHTINVAEVAEDLTREIEIELGNTFNLGDEHYLEIRNGKVKFTEKAIQLAKFVGLLHDLGHVGFGHVGESRMDNALKYCGLTAQEYNDAYFEKKEVTNKALNGRGGELKHVFEHHAQSVRVFLKILKKNNIIIEQNLLHEINMMIYCHSESRVKKLEVSEPIFAIPRCADKFYAFTDVADILVALENDFSIGNLENYLKHPSIQKALETQNIFLNEEDVDTVKDIFKKFQMQPKKAELEFKQEYVKNSKLIYTDGGWFVKQEDAVVRKVRILQAVVRYMRLTKIIGREERLAHAMMDELILYRANQFEKDENGEFKKSKKQRILESCLFLGEASDSQIRRLYGEIIKDEEWTKEFDKIGTYEEDDFEQELFKEIVDPKATEKIFPKKLLQEERELIRKNPDIILNYYFIKEIDKVENEEKRRFLILKLMRYKANPTLEFKERLIKEIEEAKTIDSPASGLVRTAINR